MSMIDSGPTTPSTTTFNEACRLQWASAIARYSHDRREQLGLTIDQAAELSGLEVSQWIALEDNWVPENLAVIRAIASTLETRWTDFDLAALFARSAQLHG